MGPYSSHPNLNSDYPSEKIALLHELPVEAVPHKKYHRTSRATRVVLLAFAVTAALSFRALLWRGYYFSHHQNMSSAADEMDEALRPLPGCPPLQHTDIVSFEFEQPNEFTFAETISTRGPFPQRIGGKLYILPGLEEQGAKVKVLVSFGSSDQHMVDNVAFHQTPSTFTIDSSKLSEQWNLFPRLCLTINAYLLIAPNTEINDLSVDVANLAVEIGSGLSVSVANLTKISSHGSVSSLEANTFTSRDTVIDVRSGSVSGSWALLDLLSIRTHSGSIKVDVSPKDAAKSHPAPAEFIASSQSGDVSARFPTYGSIPKRDYRVDVMSQSGSINGSYLHGARTKLKSSSGGINVDILPFDGSAQDTTLQTEASSGHTSVNVFAAFINSDRAMRTLQSNHEVSSGGLSLRYPQQWEGTIEGTVTSGSIHVHGRDLRIINHGDRYFEGTKGKGDSKLGFRAFSGSVDITIGET